MDNLTFNIKAIVKVMKLKNVEQLANATGINVNHLRNVSAKVTKMTLEDARKLSKFTGIPMEQITEE